MQQQVSLVALATRPFWTHSTGGNRSRSQMIRRVVIRIGASCCSPRWLWCALGHARTRHGRCAVIGGFAHLCQVSVTISTELACCSDANGRQLALLTAALVCDEPVRAAKSDEGHRLGRARYRSIGREPL
jgi:hypothetical protein